MKNFLLLFTIFCFQLGFSQQVEFLKVKNYKIATLSDSLRENSGLSFFDRKLYTINDGGNASEIFEIDKNSGKILKVIKTTLPNKDWEAITSDSSGIYIGDFGNNAGNRMDLKVYAVDLCSVFSALSAENAHVRKEIKFRYPEQKDFAPKNMKTDFDAEAMIFLNGKIHLFTKEWVSKSTTHYTLDPEISELQAAEKIEAFKTDFFVTDASYFDKKLYLIGYTKKTEVFLCIFSEGSPGIFFTQKPKKFYLGSALSVGHIEGIAVNEDGIYISGEEFRSPLGKTKQSFYFIPKERIR